MNAVIQNFGLSGQPGESYDHFICFSRKCKKRKAERHKMRMEKRKVKVDERKAGNERTRTETRLMQNNLSNNQNQAVQTQPITRQPMVNPQVMGQQFQQNQAPPQARQAGMGGPIAIVVGLLLVGGFIMSKKNKNCLTNAANSTKP